jgi:glycerate kinase
VSGLDERLKTVQIDVACNVTNPLIGENGASAIFGPQKGATPDVGILKGLTLRKHWNLGKLI